MKINNSELSVIATRISQYPNAEYGSSLMGNFLTSIQDVSLGEYAPTSVFEQRLNYTIPYEQQAKAGSMLGSTTNFFNTDAVVKNQTSVTNYNVFGTDSLAKACSAETVSSLMSILA